MKGDVYDDGAPNPLVVKCPICGCDAICPAWDDECIRLKVAFYCGEVGIADRKIHCFKRWYKYACDEALKKRPNNFKAKIERGRKDNEETK